MSTKTVTPAAAAATPSAPAPATPPAAEDKPMTFADAFAEATREDDDKTTSVAATSATAPAADAATTLTDPATAGAEGDEGKGEGAAPAGGDPAPDAAASSPAPAAAAGSTPAAAPAAPDLAAQLAAAQARIVELEKAKSAGDQPAATAGASKSEGGAAGAAPETPAEPEWYKPTDKEQTLLTKFGEDWPDINEALQVMMKQSAFNAVQYVFHEITKQYAPVMKRFGEVSETLESELALLNLRQSNNDYDTIVGHVEKWVDTQPSFFKNAAKKVLAEGTVGEVNELIAEWRKANPTQPAAATATAAASAATPAPAAPAAGSKVTEISAAAKKAAGRLAPVDSKRTAAAQAADPNDFDAAWNEAIAATK